MCMDAWELAGKGDGHILWVRISSKPDTGEATSASGTSRSNSVISYVTKSLSCIYAVN